MPECAGSDITSSLKLVLGVTGASPIVICFSTLAFAVYILC